MTGRAFAAALSEKPDPHEAVAEVVSSIRSQLGPGDPPDLAVLFVTARHVGLVGDIAAAVRTALAPTTLVGCTAETVVGLAREVERGAGLSLWAGRTGPVSPFLMKVERTPGGPALLGWPDPLPAGTSGVLLMADPFTFPADELLEAANRSHPGLPVVGGMASAGMSPGSNRLVLDGEVLDSGAVGVAMGAGVRVETVVSQGCRPVGTPFVVTRAESNIVYELGGRTALERLGDVAESLPPSDRALLGRALHFGTVIDEHKDTFGRGDFLIRNVMGGDPGTGAIAVAGAVPVGSTAQYQVRDAAAADEDLRQLLTGHHAGGALLFTCNGRGTRLFPGPDHDAAAVTDGLGGAPLAGMSCAGELGPVGGRNFLHGFTASILLVSSTAADPHAP